MSNLAKTPKGDFLKCGGICIVAGKEEKVIIESDKEVD